MPFSMTERRTGCESFTMRLSEPVLSTFFPPRRHRGTAYGDFGFREKIQSVDGLLHFLAQFHQFAQSLRHSVGGLSDVFD